MLRVRTTCTEPDGRGFVPLEMDYRFGWPVQPCAEVHNTEKKMRTKERIAVAKQKALTCASGVRKDDWVDQLIQEHALMAEVLRSEHVTLKNIVEVQALMLGLLDEVGNEPQE